MITKILILSALIFFGFRLSYFLKKRLPFSNKTRYNLGYVLALLEVIAWIGFLAWAVRMVYLSKNYSTIITIAIAFVLIIAPMYILLRDFIMGIMLKLQNKIAEGNNIEIEQIKGKIKKIGPFRLDIEDTHGNVVSIPYHTLSSKTIAHAAANTNLVKVTLEFTFSGATQVNNAVPWLKKQIMSTPWAAVSKMPIIEDITNSTDKLTVIVGVYTLDQSYGEYIKKSVDAQMIASA